MSSGIAGIAVRGAKCRCYRSKRAATPRYWESLNFWRGLVGQVHGLAQLFYGLVRRLSR